VLSVKCLIRNLVTDEIKLVSSEVRPVSRVSSMKCSVQWFEKHPQDAENRRRQSHEAGKRAKPRARARELTRRKGALDIANCRQARDCQERDPAKSRTLSRRRRNPLAAPSKDVTREYPGCLALKGKILNVERARFDTNARFAGDRHADHRGLARALAATISTSPNCATTRSSS